jgi:hypothetical protein
MVNCLTSRETIKFCYDLHDAFASVSFGKPPKKHTKRFAFIFYGSGESYSSQSSCEELGLLLRSSHF